MSDIIENFVKWYSKKIKKEKRIHTARTLQEVRTISCPYQSGREWMGKHKPVQS